MSGPAHGAKAVPRRAMVLAAGLGERLRPLTNERPKPLIELRGRALLDWILDRLEAVGMCDVVINLHHLGRMIEAHLAHRKRPRIAFSRERARLETGGGVRNALPLLGAAPFYVINGDVCWLDGRTPALRRLADAWNEATMDALVLLHPTAFAVGYAGRGDFMLTPRGRVRRRAEREVAPFVFAGIQILHPRLFEGAPEGAFSLNVLYDRAEAAGRLWGLRHDGEWFHIGTPEQLREVEDALHHLSFHSVHR
ncbi:MAG: nucleotidyltransferase family protein [Kiloniellaceae bacterium]